MEQLPFIQNVIHALIVALGIVFVFFLYYSLTNHLSGIALPAEYNVLILK